MIDPHTYGLFIATAIVLVSTPGPDTLLVLSRTLASGMAPGLATLAGTQLGNVIHALLAGIGVSTIVLLFPVAYGALKAVGVAYLLYLAVQSWRAAGTPGLLAGREPDGLGVLRSFTQGLASNLANPKMIVFFLALFPQFVRPEHGTLAGQSLLLGATLGGMAMAWIGAFVFLTDAFRSAVSQSTAFLRVAHRLAAVTFVGLACRLAYESRV